MQLVFISYIKVFLKIYRFSDINNYKYFAKDINTSICVSVIELVSKEMGRVRYLIVAISIRLQHEHVCVSETALFRNPRTLRQKMFHLDNLSLSWDLFD